MQPFDVPAFIQKPTGALLLDILPLISLFPCCTTLRLFFKTRRYGDLLMFSVGFILALVYHACQLMPQGLDAVAFLGIPGVYWRTYDVLCCLILLTRTMGHIFGATTCPFSLLPNVLFPSVLMFMYITSTRLEMSAIVILSVCTMLTSALWTVLVQDKTSVPSYRPFQGQCIFFCFYGAAIFLFLPNIYQNYWLFHSVWHVLLAAGYHLLYAELERSKMIKNGKLS